MASRLPFMPEQHDKCHNANIEDLEQLRKLISGLKDTAPSPDAPILVPAAAGVALIKKNTTTSADNNSNSNLMTPPNGSHIPDIGVPSPTASIGNPANLTTNLSAGSSQDLQQQQMDVDKRPSPLRTAAGVAALLSENAAERGLTTTTAHVIEASAPAPSPTTTTTTTTPAPQQPTFTSRLATIAAAGVPLGGRTSAQGGPSRYRGVVWHKSNSKWEARIYEAGKQRFLGYFSNEDEAALTYDDYAARIHGTSAKLNFPEMYAGVDLPKPMHVVATVAVRQHALGPRSASGGGAGAASRPRVTAPATTNNNHCNQRHSAGEGSNPHHAPAPRRNGGMRVQPVKGSSSFRGVSWNSNCSRWRAQVWKGSEVHHLGYFEHEEDAAHAYDAAVLRIRGPDAPTNYPRSQYGVYSDGFHADVEHAAHAAATSNTSYGARHANTKKDATVQDGEEDGSSMLGVSWSESHKAWISEIWNGKKYELLGTFTTEAEAAKAYDVACLAQHGSDALTNFSLENYPSESAAVALLGLSQDPHGYEELYGGASGGSGCEGETTQRGRKRSVTPPMLTHQQQYYSSNDLQSLNAVPAAKRRTVGAEKVAAVAATTTAAAEKVADSSDDGSLSFPTILPPRYYSNSHYYGGDSWRHQQRASTPTVSFGANPAAAALTAPLHNESVPLDSVEGFGTLIGKLQNFVAHQQQQQLRQLLPVLPLQPAMVAPQHQHQQQQQLQQPAVLSENAKQTLMAIVQAALVRQQEATAAASWEEHHASQQRLAVAAAVQKWNRAQQQKQQQKQQVNSAPNAALMSLKRDFASYSTENGTGTVAAALRAAMLNHQMNATAAKKPRV